MNGDRRGFLAWITAFAAWVWFTPIRGTWAAESPPMPNPPDGLQAVKFVERVEFDDKTAQLVVFYRWLYLPQDCIGPGV